MGETFVAQMSFARSTSHPPAIHQESRWRDIAINATKKT